MKNRILATLLSIGLIAGVSPASQAAVSQRHSRYSTIQANRIQQRRAQARLRHKRHVRTAKRVGIGAAGGAAIGALAGGGKGAAIGAGAGAGAGALYDRHKRKQGK